MERFLAGCRRALQVAGYLPLGTGSVRGFPCSPSPWLPWSSLLPAQRPPDHVQHHQEVHVVLGNEACDLDSMVSALTLAYYLTQTAAGARAAIVPVLNIPRTEFPLRSESIFLLREQGIPDGCLIFRDEIDLVMLHRAGLLTLTLVDHHILPSGDAALEEAVIEVIDHRPLERDWGPRRRVTVEPVGSCTTLVAERVMEGPPELLDRQTAALLHGTILLDCVNLAPEARKVTPKDARYVALLEARFPDLPARDIIFETLQKAKFDVTGLTTEQVLQKDLKVLSGDQLIVAISAVYMTLEEFLQRPGLQHDLPTFCQQHSYTALVAMTISFGERHEPHRQLAVYSPCARLRATLCSALERASSPPLDLSPLPSPCPDLCTYRQGNVAASRKKVLPILRELLLHGGPEPWGCRAGEEAMAEDEALLPPTPMNSLVDDCPLARGLPALSPEAVFERVSRLAVVRPGPAGSPEKK
ncbi:exopolyphosphatase PRUNE1 isoform X2 [Alligator mississippiensis]|uniref:exopolyphosphatase PRUNE1 isoform X2 n=1 Tax=Alligator mississippiensis TaxID=8496 RepID=UPI0028777F13|nr:exopolyphosphatase PRUNE1 isoform X2 [Alligator mississippiensis]